MHKLIILISIIIFSTEVQSQQRLSLLNNDNLIKYTDSSAASIVRLNPFSNIGCNIVNSFTGTENIMLQLSGIAATAAIASSNIDNRVSTYFRDNESYSKFAQPAVIIGATLPLTAGAFLYTYGKLSKDNRMVGASFAVLQAGLITVSYISLLKGITGRAHPDPNDAPLDRSQVSRTFHFGIVRSGIYRGWPSGHVGGAMAVASSLSSYYPEKTWLKVLSYSWVGYTMASVSVFHKGTMHWFSDAVAAGLMTYSIGTSVGKFYHGELTDKSEKVKFKILPVFSYDYSGVYMGYSF